MKEKHYGRPEEIASGRTKKMNCLTKRVAEKLLEKGYSYGRVYMTNRPPSMTGARKVGP